MTRVVIADPAMLRYAEGQIGEEVEVHDHLAAIALAEGWATEPGKRKASPKGRVRTGRSRSGGGSAGARSGDTRKGRRGSGG